MLLDQVAQPVEPGVAGGTEAHRGRLSAQQFGQQRTPQRVALEAAVPHRAEDLARAGSAEELLATAAGDPAVVDLVARGGCAQDGAGGQSQHLLGGEVGADVEQPQPLDLGTRHALDTGRVADGTAEHLEAAADAEHGATSAGVVEDRGVQAPCAQPCQVADRRAGPRHHDHVGIGDVAGVGDEDDVEVGLQTERVDVGEVADSRQPHDRDPEGGLTAGATTVQVEGVLGVQPQARIPRQYAEHATARQPLQGVQAGGEERQFATELVDHEAGHQPLVGGLQECDRAVHRGEDTATVDVAHDHGGQRCVPGQPHVDVVAGAQVDLGRAPCSLSHDDVEARGEVVVRGVCGRGQVTSAGLPVRRRDLAGGVAHQDDMAAPVAAGLEQHRVHRRLRGNAGSQCLDPLCPADLGGRAVGGGADHRVVRHVLGLVRRHLHATSREGAAQAGGEDRLAGVRGRPGDEQTAHGCVSRARSR